MNDGRWLRCNVITAYLRTQTINPLTHIFQPYLWERIQWQDYEGLRKFVPKDDFKKWYVPICINIHWVAVIIDKTEKTITQYDTLSRNTEVAKRLKKEFNKINELIEYRVASKQPIYQVDGYNCGIHVLDIFLQDDKTNKITGIKLKRNEVYKTMKYHYGHLPLAPSAEDTSFGGGGYQ